MENSDARLGAAISCFKAQAFPVLIRETYRDLSLPTTTYLYLLRPITTHCGLSQPTTTYLYLLRPISTYCDLSRLTATYLYLLLPITTYLDLLRPISTYCDLSLPTTTYHNLLLPISTYCNLSRPTATFLFGVSRYSLILQLIVRPVCGFTLSFINSVPYNMFYSRNLSIKYFSSF